MIDKMKERLKAAGFILWEDEEWREDSVVDWSCDYDASMNLYTNLLINEIADEVWTRLLFETADMDSDQKYLTRGVVYSILQDLRETHKNEKV